MLRKPALVAYSGDQVECGQPGKSISASAKYYTSPVDSSLQAVPNEEEEDLYSAIIHP